MLALDGGSAPAAPAAASAALGTGPLGSIGGAPPLEASPPSFLLLLGACCSTGEGAGEAARRPRSFRPGGAATAARAAAGAAAGGAVPGAGVVARWTTLPATTLNGFSCSRRRREHRGYRGGQSVLGQRPPSGPDQYRGASGTAGTAACWLPRPSPLTTRHWNCWYCCMLAPTPLTTHHRAAMCSQAAPAQPAPGPTSPCFITPGTALLEHRRSCPVYLQRTPPVYLQRALQRDPGDAVIQRHHPPLSRDVPDRPGTDRDGTQVRGGHASRWMDRPAGPPPAGG